MLIALLCSLRGTPFIYQGEELGLPEADIPFESILDPWGKYLYPKWKGRDGCRTPMPWSNDPGAGFSQAPETWLPIPEEHLALSVAEQGKDRDSALSFTRSFLKWRNGQSGLVTGDIIFHDAGREDVLIFDRTSGNDVIRCIFNLSPMLVTHEDAILQPYESRFTQTGKILYSS